MLLLLKTAIFLQTFQKVFLLKVEGFTGSAFLQENTFLSAIEMDRLFTFFRSKTVALNTG